MKKYILLLLLLPLIGNAQRGIGGIISAKDTSTLFFIQPTRANITDGDQINYVNYIVKMLKGFDLWNLNSALYPFVGGTAARHRLNLINENSRLVNGSIYDITWFGGVTHNANGVTGNGTNGYGNTNLNDANTNVFPLNSHHLSVYNKSNIMNSTVDLGILTTSRRFIWSYQTNNVTGVSGNDALAQSYVSTAVANGRNYNILSRTASNNLALYTNGILGGNTNVGQTMAIINLPFFVLAVNFNGSPVLYSSNNLAFASIGVGLNATQAANQSAIVQQAQVILNRAN